MAVVLHSVVTLEQSHSCQKLPDSISEQLVVNIFLGGSNTNADETTIHATLHVDLANRLPNTNADETTIHTLLHTCFVYALCVACLVTQYYIERFRRPKRAEGHYICSFDCIEQANTWFVDCFLASCMLAIHTLSLYTPSYCARSTTICM